MYYWLPKWTNYNLKRHLQGFPYIGYKLCTHKCACVVCGNALKIPANSRYLGTSVLKKSLLNISPLSIFVIRGSGKSGVLECVGRMYPLCSFMLSSTWKSSYIYVNQSFQNIMHKATSQNSYQININILDWFKCVFKQKKCFLWLAGMNNANFVEKKYVLSASFVVWILYSAINWAFHCLYIQIRNSFWYWKSLLKQSNEEREIKGKGDLSFRTCAISELLYVAMKTFSKLIKKKMIKTTFVY